MKGRVASWAMYLLPQPDHTVRPPYDSNVVGLNVIVGFEVVGRPVGSTVGFGVGLSVDAVGLKLRVGAGVVVGWALVVGRLVGALVSTVSSSVLHSIRYDGWGL